MLQSEVNVDVKEFKTTFDKKFSNFCKKAPLFLSYITGDNKVDIYLHENPQDRTERTHIMSYPFDFSLDVKENIFHIKCRLVKEHYPRLYQHVQYEESYDAQELNRMVENGEISVEDIGTYGLLREKEVVWRIERVIIMKDILFVRNLDDGRIYSYKMKMPVTVFLRKIRDKTSEQAWNLFQQKAILQKEFEEDEETRHLLWEKD